MILFTLQIITLEKKSNKEKSKGILFYFNFESHFPNTFSHLKLSPSIKFILILTKPFFSLLFFSFSFLLNRRTTQPNDKSIKQSSEKEAPKLLKLIVITTTWAYRWWSIYIHITNLRTLTTKTTQTWTKRLKP